MYIPYLLYVSVDGHLGWVSILATVHSAATQMYKHLCGMLACIPLGIYLEAL